MVELKATISRSGYIYLPKEVRGIESRKIRVITDSFCYVIAPANLGYEDILKSIEIIELELKHRMNLMEKMKEFSKVNSQN